MLAGIRLAPREGYTDEQHEVLRLLIEVLWLAAAQLNLRFTETAEVDFTEISRRAVQALGQVDDPSDLLLSLDAARSEEHTSELQSLMRISYAVFCLKKTTTKYRFTHTSHHPTQRKNKNNT